ERESGAAEPLDVAAEQHGLPAAHANGLEGGRTAEKRLVVWVEHRGRGVDEADARDRRGEEGRHAGTRLPTAARSGLAFTQDSSTPPPGSESKTIPPPTERWTRPAATASVLIVRARSKSPSGCTTPSAPIEAPRPTGSSEAIRS